MVTYVGIITVLVNDQQRALEFWRDQVGFRVRDDREMAPGVRWMTVAPAEGQTALCLWPAAMAQDGRRPGGFCGIVLESDDIAEDFAELTELGVQFTQEPKRETWGISAIFADPDGNLFNLVQRAEAGQVQNTATR